MSADAAVDFGMKTGTIKPLHGVNNGPVCYGSLVDVSRYYKELGVPWVRIHDPNWPHPREVDYYTIFPDFDKDVDDPASYAFGATDTYIQSIVATGARIVYRLGVSIEHTRKKYHVHPPADFVKWARICIHIIRHYNEGWANGFHYEIKHWEIWNEPEGSPDCPQDKNPMWSGTREQYFELYRVASTMIKQACPDVNVGGFAYTYMQPVYMEQFLSSVKSNGAPLDFFSWHTYTYDPLTMAAHAREVKEALDRHGFIHAEIHCNEYNYVHPMPEGWNLFSSDANEGMEAFFEASKNEEGASFNASVLILLQDCPVDVLNFYDAAPSSWWSFFNCYGVPQKAYYAFKAFKQLYDLQNRVETAVANGIGGLYCLGAAGSDGESGAVLLANFNAPEGDYTIEMKLPEGKAGATAEAFAIDHECAFTSAGSFALEKSMQITRRMKPYSVLFLKIKFLTTAEGGDAC
jgi:xylan 1,4-beta-xylosidase